MDLIRIPLLFFLLIMVIIWEIEVLLVNGLITKNLSESPMVIYDPRASLNAAESTNDEIALNIDIPATILGLAGISQPKIYQ
jgi:phosphoglycerol transferase MdoB-like AlkP superfamily enzyme